MKTVIERVLARDHHDEAFYQLLDGADRAELPAFLALAEHPDPLVRRDLVSLLPMLDSGSPQPASVQIAITLDRDTRSEALLGLAFRHDERALPRVTAALSRRTGDVWRLELIAAGALGDPSLHRLVLGHLDGWDDDAQLSVEAVRRLTDPAGPEADLFARVGNLYRHRADGRPDSAADLSAWLLMSQMLDIAPDRAAAFFTATAPRVSDDPSALAEFTQRSALATMLGLTDETPAANRQ